MRKIILLAVLLCAAGGLTAFFVLRDQSQIASLGTKAAPVEHRHVDDIPMEEGPGAVNWQSAERARKERSGKTSFESTLVSADGLRVELASKLMSDDRFDTVLAKLRDESLNDVEARELTEIYRKNIGSALTKADPDISLKELACGLSICGIDFSSDANQDEYFVAVLNSGQPGGAGIYSAVTHIVPNKDGSFSYRMVFSTDPAVNTIKVPRKAPKPG
jgi:hypothetical protein